MEVTVMATDTNKPTEEEWFQNLFVRVTSHANTLACSCGDDRDNERSEVCRYCYANSDKDAVRANMRYNERSDCRACTSRHCANKHTESTDDVRLHDPKSPLLVGRLMDTDVMHEAKQESWVDRQMRLEDFL